MQTKQDLGGKKRVLKFYDVFQPLTTSQLSPCWFTALGEVFVVMLKKERVMHNNVSAFLKKQEHIMRILLPNKMNLCGTPWQSRYF